MPFTEVAVRHVRTCGPMRRIDWNSAIARVDTMPGRLYAITLIEDDSLQAIVEIVVELVDLPPGSDAERCHDPGRAVPSVLRCAGLRCGPPPGS